MNARPTHQFPACLAACLTALLLQGCGAPLVIASAGLGALQTGTTAFIRGELESAEPYPLDVAHQAARDGLVDLRLPIVSERITRNSAAIIASETGGRAVKIYLERKSPVVSKINIRVGVWGDQAMSRLVQQAIQKRFPETFVPPEAPPAPPPKPERTKPLYTE